MPRAVVCGRRSAPSPFCCSTVSSASVWIARDLLRLAQPERRRAAGAAADLAEQRDLGLRAPLAVAVALAERGRGLEHAALTVAHHLRDREQLVRVGVRAGNDAAVGHPVQRGARGREPERARVDRLGDELAHRLDVGLGACGRLVDRPLAHRVDAHRAVPDHAADVHALGHAVDRVEVLAVGLPVPAEALHDRVGGDVLDRLHHLGEVLPVLGLARRERHAAVAEHHRRDAVPARRRADRVPRELRVEVGVDVDEAGGDELAVGVDLPRARARRPRRRR